MTTSWLNDQFLYVRPHNHERRIHRPLQAADRVWYGEAHFNHRYIRVQRVSNAVWIPAEEVSKLDNNKA